jgi:hypothetical protein
MTREEIIRMAREAGFDDFIATDLSLERFAHLVAAAERVRTVVAAFEVAERRVAEEREACAVVAEKAGVHPALNVYNGGPDWYKHGKEIAAEIRARGKE